MLADVGADPPGGDHEGAARGSPIGQVTVTSVVKHLTLGSGLNLTDGPVVRLPGGEHVQLFVAARPSGSAGLTDPTQNG